MKDSLKRVRAVLDGETPDRPPLYDLLRNDAVISHFAGEPLTVENGQQVVYRAFEPALDATRPLVRLPLDETEEIVDGRCQRTYRWTVWHEPRQYADVNDYVKAMRTRIRENPPDWSSDCQEQMKSFLARIADDRQRLGEVFYFPSVNGPGLFGIYGEVGFVHFAYYLADAPAIIDEQLAYRVERATVFAEHLPPDHGIEAVFLGDDIAFKSGPLLSPAWFREHYFAGLARIIDAYHRQGIKVLFHSDGNLNPILDGLVEAGIDGLNPIEILAGMDVGEIHRRYPHLFLAGGIDVSELLTRGTPQQVRDTVTRTLDDGGGRLMVGSSTEIHNEVPLANYLALREAVLDYRY
jgi:hypothetical protein